SVTESNEPLQPRGLKRLFYFMRPLLCVTVTAPTTAELRLRRDAVCAGDLVELRLDSVSDPDVAGALADRRRPVIVTCRSAWEGGWFDGSEEERRRLLSEALALGAEYVDVEWRARFDGLIAGAGGRRIVLSMHDFDGVPADLEAQAAAMCGTGAEVVKLAVLTRKLSDCVPLLEIGSRNGGAPGAESGGRRGLVLIGMESRVLPRGCLRRASARCGRTQERKETWVN